MFHTPGHDSLAYVHIPKTAGNAMDRLLLGEVARGDLYDRAEDVSPDTVLDPKPKVIAGHRTISVMRKLCATNDLDAMYLSCMRQPVDRLISAMHYECRFGDRVAHGRMQFGKELERLGFEPFLRQIEDGSRGQLLFQNIQSNFLLKQSQLILNQLDPQEFERTARQQLEGFAVIGIMERFAESTVLIAHHARLLAPQTISRQNRNETRKDEERHALRDPEVIERFAGADNRLYALAAERFARQYDKMQEELLESAGIAPSAFQKLDEGQRTSRLRELVNASVLAERAASQPEAGSIVGALGLFPGAVEPAAQAPFLSGPARRDRLAKGSKVRDLTWIGFETPAVLHLKRPPADATHLVLDVVACTHRAYPFKLAITSNDKPLPYRLDKPDGGDLQLVIPLPEPLPEPDDTDELVTIVIAPFGSRGHFSKLSAGVNTLVSNTIHDVSIGIDPQPRYLTGLSPDDFERIRRLTARPAELLASCVHLVRLAEPRPISGLVAKLAKVRSRGHLHCAHLLIESPEPDRIVDGTPVLVRLQLRPNRTFECNTVLNAVPARTNAFRATVDVQFHERNTGEFPAVQWCTIENLDGDVLYEGVITPTQEALAAL